MIRFADSIKAVAPHATGQPVSIQGAGQTVKRAFLEAGAIAIGLIFIILWIVLRPRRRRPADARAAAPRRAF